MPNLLDKKELCGRFHDVPSRALNPPLAQISVSEAASAPGSVSTAPISGPSSPIIWGGRYYIRPFVLTCSEHMKS